MTSNPIRGPATNSPTRTNPDPTKGAPTEHRKIEKVEDVDAEEQSKRRKFNAFFKEEPTEETPAIKLPSPLEIVELANKEKKEGSTHLEGGNEQTNQTTKKSSPSPIVFGNKWEKSRSILRLSK